MTNAPSQQAKTIHFIGIGGSGMTPLAELALDMGFQVTGSDSKLNANCQRLAHLGAQIFSQHDPQNISQASRVVVSSAIPDTNVELMAAHKKPAVIVQHRSEYLKELAEGHKLIAVTGTHGKTTTAALIAHMLEFCNLQPKAAIGGEMLNYGRYSMCGPGSFFVIEADESDGSFLNFHPYIAIINNIDADHLDHYETIENVQATFSRFLQQLDPEGCAIVNWDDPMTFEISQHITGERLTFGQRLGSEIRLLKRKFNKGRLSFEAMIDHQHIHGQASLMGRHNTQNILAALTIAHLLELDMDNALKAIANFHGAKRRLSCNFRAVDDSIIVYDDYAHNPKKISSCVEAIKEAFPEHFLHVLFQPHRYSRLKTMYNGFIEAFRGSDQIDILPVFAAGEPKPDGFDLTPFKNDVAKRSGAIVRLLEGFPTSDQLLEEHKGCSKRLFLTVGAGDVNQIAVALRDRLNGKATTT